MEGVFDWFNDHVRTVNGIIQTLNIGKGFEQCLSAAEEENIKSYKLTGLSNTRFAAYFERSLSNFEKSFPVIVKAPKERASSKDKDTKDNASSFLRRILTKTFICQHLGLIDIYRTLGTLLVFATNSGTTSMDSSRESSGID